MIPSICWAYVHFMTALDDLQKLLQELQAGDPPDVDLAIRLERVLLYSFDTLTPEQQQMFLDAATVFAGQPQDLALVVWNAWYDCDVQFALEGLVRRSMLLDPKESPSASRGLLLMHDVLRYLGRGLVRGKGHYPESYRKYAGSRLFVSSWQEEEGFAAGIGGGTKQVYEIFGYVKVSECASLAM
jgi:hypothetical protein